jgi:hypothetical protein
MKRKKSKKTRKKTKKTKPRKRFKKSSFKRKKKLRTKRKTKKIRAKKIKKTRKIKQPLDRLKAIKLSRFKLKKIKVPKIKLKRKQMAKIPKYTGQIIKLSFQKMVNFLLTPIFRAYDNYFENKKIKRLEKIAFEKKERERQIKEEEQKLIEDKKRELQFEKKLERERKYDLRKFIQEGQAQLRKDLQDKKRKLYESMQIQRKLDQFAKREAKEVAGLEHMALRENISEYRTVQEAIERIRLKYKQIRENKIRKRIGDLGIHVEDQDTREDLFRKEKEFNEKRLQVEIVLESYFRSAQSLVFQINKRWLPKQSEILRVIDRRWEENLFYIRYDNEIEDNWIFLIYLEDDDTDKKTIAVEDKSDESKNIVKKFNTNEVFAYSDFLTDRIVAHLDRLFQKRKEAS